MPLYRRVPKFGFKNPFRLEYDAVNLSSLDTRFEEGATPSRSVNCATVSSLPSA